MNYSASVSTTTIVAYAADLAAINALQKAVNWVYLILDSFSTLGLLFDATTLLALFFTRHGVGKTARIYYMSLTVCDLTILFWYHVLNVYIENSIPGFLGTVLLIVRSGDVICKFQRFVWFSTEFSLNWLYVAFSSEKLISVLRPLQSRGKFTEKRAVLTVLVVACCGLPFGCIEAVIQGQLKSLGLISCVTLNQYPLFEIYYRIFCNILLFVVPTVLTVLINFSVIGVLSAHSSSRKIIKTTDAKAQAATAPWYSLTANFSVGGTRSLYTAYVFQYYAITLAFPSVSHWINFFVYLTRIPAFRETVFKFFTICCHTKNSVSNK